MKITAIPFCVGSFLVYWLGYSETPDFGIATCLIMSILVLTKQVKLI